AYAILRSTAAERQTRRSDPLFAASRMRVVVGARRLSDRIVAKPLCIECAGHFQHLCGLLADHGRRNRSLLEGELVGEAGIPPIELARRVARAGSAEMFYHGFLISDDRVLVAQPKF